jgi:hypothetical protein
LMWAVAVEVSLVSGQHCARVPFVVKQHVVDALSAYAANEPFGVAVAVRPRRAGQDLRDCTPSAASTASNVEVNLPSRSATGGGGALRGGPGDFRGRCGLL